MNPYLKKILVLLVVALISTYLLVFLGIHLSYMGRGFIELKSKAFVAFRPLLWLSLMGSSLALLSALCTWPFALSIATLLKLNKRRKFTSELIGLIRFFASMPLILFAYLFLEVVGFKVFNLLESFWLSVFASTNFLTQTLAFALTLLLYPLTVIPGFLKQVSVDLFYRNMLVAVAEFAEVGLVSSVVVFGLVISILPKMVLRMLSHLEQDQNLISYEVIQSLGGTQWESIYMTVLQSMKDHFNLIIVRFTRICFFEGLLTWSLLSFFFRSEDKINHQWSATLSSLFIGESMVWSDNVQQLTLFAGALTVSYIFFMVIEKFFFDKVEVNYG